jgi:hypothetical protein
MSAANIGITQLEALQLRNLLGPKGIGSITKNNSTAPVQISLNTLADPNYFQGTYLTPFYVPSGTGIMYVRIEGSLPGLDPTALPQMLFYEVTAGASAGGGIPIYVPVVDNSGWIYTGVMIYSNPSATPAQISIRLGCTLNTLDCFLTNIEMDTLSFGPYVDQGQ